jgi:hypothetical protein
VQGNKNKSQQYLPEEMGKRRGARDQQNEIDEF